jgi:hypothetical protein
MGAVARAVRAGGLLREVSRRRRWRHPQGVCSGSAEVRYRDSHRNCSPEPRIEQWRCTDSPAHSHSLHAAHHSFATRGLATSADASIAGEEKNSFAHISTLFFLEKFLRANL